MTDHRNYFIDNMPNVGASVVDDYKIRLFRYQYTHNIVYNQYCNLIGRNIQNVLDVDQIPFLPISAFKHNDVVSGSWDAQEIFLSSGTTHQILRSRHSIRDIDLYHKNAAEIWNHHYGPLQDYTFLALLPGYLERDGSSLISMVNYFIDQSNQRESGFYLRNFDALHDQLLNNRDDKKKTVLFGVSYALLDFIDAYKIEFSDLIIFETGGMKGQRPEMTKDALHYAIKNGFGVSKIHSEYGMTELLSQSYSQGDGIFKMNSRLTVSISQVNDPLSREKMGKAGILQVTDLCNIDSCAFIETQDIGRLVDDNSFEILGRLDIADIRGCNLLVSDVE